MKDRLTEDPQVPVRRIDLDPEWDFAFSSCVVAGDYIFTAHHSGYRREQRAWPEGIEEQTEQCFTNLERSLAAAGATLNDVVKTTVLLKTARHFQRMNDVYRRHFEGGYPARTGLVTGFLDPECLVQIEAVAYKPK
jgi:2-iminobutanoate/2-iminopropanoate deaminase